ncbi:MAG: lysophospholipid acyltransferase family protein [Maribacter dokdonensis]|uniref:lysophospholipid acyltransferase family protein n=2 Tax=Maribacter dokdonensis TaxID=320912 RepID=UPI0032641F6B
MKYLRFFPFYVLSILPFWILYMISDITYFLTYYILGYRKKVVCKNLHLAFPNKSEKEINSIAKKFYKHFCDMFFESIKLLTIKPSEIENRFKINDLSQLTDHLKNNENIMLYTAHQGNWEWLTTVPLFLEVNCNTLYKPLSNTYFNDLFILMRERFNVHCIPSNKGYRHLLHLKNNNVVSMNCVIGDQSPLGKSGKSQTQFFNQQTSFFTGAAKIAKKTDSIIFLPYLKKIKRGTYELFFETIVNSASNLDEQNIIETYAHKLEEVIQKYPELYLWTHKRWKRDGITY